MTEESINNTYLELKRREKHLKRCLAALRAKYNQMESEAQDVLLGCQNYFESFGTGAIHHPNLDNWPTMDQIKEVMNQYLSTHKELKRIVHDLSQIDI